MKTRKAALAAMSIVLCVCLVFSGCKKKQEQAAGQQGGPGGRGGDRTPVVEVIPAQVKPMELVKQYVGAVKPHQSVEIRSTGSGWLTGIDVDAGDRVAGGQVLASIENEDIQAQVDQAKANMDVAAAALDEDRAGISAANASLARARAELEKTAQEAERMKKLHNAGYVSTRELEQAQASEKQAQASVDAAKAQVDQAEASLAADRGRLDQAKAALKNIQVKLRDTAIKAPFSGAVSERFVDPGAYVSPSTPIVTLVDDSSVLAVVNIVEEDFPALRVGAEATITSDAYPDETFTGKIVRIQPAMDTESRTSAAEILVENNRGRLRTGMTVRVSLIVDDNPRALAVPEDALKKDVETGKEYVFLLVDGKAASRDVETGIMADGFVEINKGLRVGDKVISSTGRLSDGMEVKTGGDRGKGGGAPR